MEYRRWYDRPPLSEAIELLQMSTNDAKMGNRFYA